MLNTGAQVPAYVYTHARALTYVAASEQYLYSLLSQTTFFFNSWDGK